MKVITKGLCATGLLSGALLGGAADVWAAGLGIDEMSVRRLGDAFSGGAAESTDASVVWYNPAALTHLNKAQLSAGAIAIPHDTRFKGEVNLVQDEEAIHPVTGRNKHWTGTELVPDVYVALPLTEQLWFGAGMNSPWGSGSTFNKQWLGRYQSVESRLLTVNLLTVLGWKISDEWSIGGGLVTQYADGVMKKSVLLGAPDPANDGHFKGQGDNVAVGWTAGVHYQPLPDWQFGVHYRSAIRHTLKGHMEIDVPEAVTLASSEKVKADLGLKIPETFSLSAAHQLNEDWTIKADATWTRWDCIDELRFHPKTYGQVFTQDEVQVMDWSNTWRFAIGAEYRLTPSWLLRAGIAKDNTPIPNHTATLDFAINDYRALSLGATWELNEDLAIDMAVQHTWTTTLHITENANTPDEDVVVRAQGRLINRVNSIGAGLRWRF
ncbi:OmpP1/FadL family transporter [Parendozoicomonas haliclonae]|uniref:OmpP1/FadL family transporter n=1 Tax=Parendozoicomonas haliclonae TaxID=1960125 RepID=UPI00105643AC|nr:outer membrane protein transport protein [Parendozoicomonas haliclonae]